MRTAWATCVGCEIGKDRCCFFFRGFCLLGVLLGFIGDDEEKILCMLRGGLGRYSAPQSSS